MHNLYALYELSNLYNTYGLCNPYVVKRIWKRKQHQDKKKILTSKVEYHNGSVDCVNGPNGGWRRRRCGTKGTNTKEDKGLPQLWKKRVHEKDEREKDLNILPNWVGKHEIHHHEDWTKNEGRQSNNPDAQLHRGVEMDQWAENSTFLS